MNWVPQQRKDLEWLVEPSQVIVIIFLPVISRPFNDVYQLISAYNIIFFDMQNFMFGVLSPPMYYFYAHPINTCLPPPVQAPELQQDSHRKNAEIITQENISSNKIRVSKQDLLREGYDKTKRAWTEEQDALLKRLCRDENARFEDIAEHVPGRNAKMCYSRYRRLTQKSKNYWSKLQNIRLNELVRQLGVDSWQRVAQLFPTNRNHKQLKDHYQNYLRPNLSKEEWTLEDDLELIDLFNTYGMNWSVIQDKLPSRSRNQIKNRYFGRILRLDAKIKEQVIKIEPSVKEQAFVYSM